MLYQKVEQEKKDEVVKEIEVDKRKGIASKDESKKNEKPFTPPLTFPNYIAKQKLDA